MNRERDFDETMADWLDEGADRAPERFVWAALEDAERTPQRGAWRVSLEELFMHLKPAAPILGVAAILALAVVAFQLVRTSDVGGPSPTPRYITSGDLPSIILTESNVPDGMTVRRTLSGYSALTTAPPPGGAPVDAPPGFVDALLTDLDAEPGRYATVAAVYETAADAERAYDADIATHESPDGWGLTPSSTDPGLGDESVAYTGPAYGEGTVGIYIWRVNNVFLTAVGVEDYDPARVLSIAEGMDARAH